MNKFKPGDWVRHKQTQQLGYIVKVFDTGVIILDTTWPPTLYNEDEFFPCPTSSQNSIDQLFHSPVNYSHQLGNAPSSIDPDYNKVQEEKYGIDLDFEDYECWQEGWLK